MQKYIRDIVLIIMTIIATLAVGYAVLIAVNLRSVVKQTNVNTYNIGKIVESLQIKNSSDAIE